MRILYLGDLMGRTGRQAVIREAANLISVLKLDGLFVNAENAAGGFGLTSEIANDLFAAGVDGITLGNHAFGKRDIIPLLLRETRIVRPLNYPVGTPGHGFASLKLKNGARALLLNPMGQVYMAPIDNPFHAVREALEPFQLGQNVDTILVDMHAEATSEKQAMGLYLDGQVSLVVGTHTHTPTADHRILAGGTGYISDLGMCGCYDSVLGMEKQTPLERFLRPAAEGRLTPAGGEATLSGILVEIDDKSGLCRKIDPFRQGGVLEPTPTNTGKKR